jgi:DNA-binding YbaB/EbfC family protein
MRGFGNMGNIGGMGNLMKQAQKMMEQAKQIEEELGNETVEGTAGGGMVTAQATGLGRVIAIKIDPQVVDPQDVEMLQDLVLSAVHEALDRSEQLRQDRQKQLMGGIGLPPGMF